MAESLHAHAPPSTHKLRHTLRHLGVEGRYKWDRAQNLVQLPLWWNRGWQWCQYWWWCRCQYRWQSLLLLLLLLFWYIVVIIVVFIAVFTRIVCVVGFIIKVDDIVIIVICLILALLMPALYLCWHRLLLQ